MNDGARFSSTGSRPEACVMDRNTCTCTGVSALRKCRVQRDIHVHVHVYADVGA